MKNIRIPVRLVATWTAIVGGLAVWFCLLLVLADFVDIEMILVILGALVWLAIPVGAWHLLTGGRRGLSIPAPQLTPAKSLLPLRRVGGEKTDIRILG